MARFGLRPATPGTLAVLVAFILLLLVSLSTPILKSIYFLKTNVSVNVDVATINVGINGTIKLGMWGYCAQTGSATEKCSNTTLGYTLDADNLFGVPADVSQYISIPDALIKGLTYALIVHPIAAALAGVSLIFGICAHVRELQTSGISICIAGTASFLALLAFIFDIVTFSIARSRLQSASVDATAELGNAIWMTLVAMIFLMSSGIFFCIGRCCIRSRPDEEKKKSSRPAQDTTYSSKLRRDAEEDMDRRRQEPSSIGRRRGEAGLPAFAEYETVPLTRRDGVDEDLETGGYSDMDHKPEQGSTLNGVGVGYGRRDPSAMPDGSGYAPRQQPAGVPLTSQTRTEPFQGMYNQGQPTSPTSPSRNAAMPFGAAALSPGQHTSPTDGASIYTQQSGQAPSNYPPTYVTRQPTGYQDPYSHNDPYAPPFAGAAAGPTSPTYGPTSPVQSPPGSQIGSQFFSHNAAPSTASAYPAPIPYASPTSPPRQLPELPTSGFRHDGGYQQATSPPPPGSGFPYSTQGAAPPYSPWHQDGQGGQRQDTLDGLVHGQGHQQDPSLGLR